MPGLSGLTGPSGLSGIFGGGTYISKVLGYGPIAYWVLNETAGGTAADQVNSPAQDGAYTGVSLANAIGPDGVNSAPLFDGANDFVNIYSAALQSAFNGSEGTIMIWCKVFNVGVWTDGTNRYSVQCPYGDGNNFTKLYRIATNNRLRSEYRANATLKVVNIDGLSNTAWFHHAITWSASGDAMKVYYNGSQSGATQTGLGAWNSATLSNTNNCIGAFDTGANSPWYGWLAHCALWTSALGATTIADLATV